MFGVGELRYLAWNSGETAPFERQPEIERAKIPDIRNLLSGLRFWHGTLSRDGSRIAVRNNGMLIIELEPFSVKKGNGNAYASWSPDDQYLMCGADRGIVVVPVYSEEMVAAIPLGSGDDPSWSPRFGAGRD